MILRKCRICMHDYTSERVSCPVCATLAIKLSGQNVTYPSLTLIGSAVKADYWVCPASGK